MKDEVYEYLINYGFNKDNINKIENEDVYFITLSTKIRLKAWHKSIENFFSFF